MIFREIPLVELTAKGQNKFIEEDFVSNCMKTTKYNLYKKQKLVSNKKSSSRVQRNKKRVQTREHELSVKDIVPTRETVFKKSTEVPEHKSSSFGFSSPNESFTTSHIELQHRNSKCSPEYRKNIANLHS